MSPLTFSPFRRHAVATALAVSGWLAFAGLASVTAMAPRQDAEAAAPRAAPVADPAAYAGPASPSFRDEEPEPPPPTF